MPDFKGRKDFPEVDDKKIKIGDYSGTNRLSVVDIFSPKEKPELRDQMIEPVKGNKANNYDSPMLSQQPVIVLSDDESEEAALIKAIIDDVEDAALIKAIDTIEKITARSGRRQEVGGTAPPPDTSPGPAPTSRGAFRNSPMDTGGDARRADAAVDAELAALKTKHPGPKTPPPLIKPDVLGATDNFPYRPKGQEYGMPGPSATGTAPKTHVEAAERTRRPAGQEWGKPGPSAVEGVSKARRPIPDDRGPKDDPWDDRGRPKHPGAPERPHPEPEYPGPREKRDPMPGERKKDWTLGKAAGDPKIHVDSPEAQQLIEEYLSSQGPKQSKMGHGVDTETGEQHLYPDPKVSSKSGRRIQKNLKKEFSGVEKFVWPGKKNSGAMPMMSTDKKKTHTKSQSSKSDSHFSHDRPGSMPAFKSDDIDLSLLKDISDLLEKVTAVPDFMAQGKGQAPKSPKTDSPSVPEPAKPATTPKPEAPAATPERNTAFTGWKNAAPAGDVKVTSAKVPKPAETPATPKKEFKSNYMRELTSPGSTQQWGKPGPSAPAATPDASAATPDAPAATGGKMKGAGKRVGAGVKDFGTGFGEGFSGGTSDGGSGTGVNINVGGGGGSTTASGGGGGPSAPADTSADDDAGVRASQEATGADYSQGESTTGSSATPSGVQRGTAPTQSSAKSEEDSLREQIMAETGWTAEKADEAMGDPDKPGIPSRVAQTVKRAAKGAAIGAGKKALGAAGGALTRGLDRAASSRFAFADISEEEEETVKSWNYSG